MAQLGTFANVQRSVRGWCREWTSFGAAEVAGR
jgi:hypothetical protein